MDQVDSANYVKLCLLKGYWHVPLHPRAKEISAFITLFGLFILLLTTDSVPLEVHTDHNPLTFFVLFTLPKSQVDAVAFTGLLPGYPPH